MFFLPPVRQIPGNDHIRYMDVNLRDHVSALNDVQSDFKDFFQRSLAKYAQTTPEELKPIYTKFIESGNKFAVSFGKFIKKFSSQIKNVTLLDQKYEIVKREFGNYCDDVKAIRTEETPALVEQEKKDLLRFVKSFTEYNNDSNAFISSFLLLYVNSINQLSADTEAFLQAITAQIESFTPLETTKEEKNLDSLIQKLEKEVQMQNKKVTKPEQAEQSNQTDNKQINPSENQEQQQNTEKDEQEEIIS